MPKLSGKQYLEYWRKRIAAGPDQVSFNGRDADRQGDDIWRFISEELAALKPKAVLDFGCGYGRMMRRLHALWPKARMHGVDICQAALKSIGQEENWFACGKPKLSGAIPERLKVDVAFDCMALQHITDDDTRRAVITAMRQVLRKGGRLVLFENIAQPGAAHVLDYAAEDYMKLWPELKWEQCGVLMLGMQGHALMIGAKQ